MKKYIFLSLILLVSNFVYGQDQTNQDSTSNKNSSTSANILKMNPFSLLAFRSVNIGFERSLNDKSSILVGLNHFQWRNIFEDDLSGTCLQVGYRLYFSRKDIAPEGLFISPILELGPVTSISDNSNQENQHTFTVSGGARGGYQWIFKNGVALDMFFGYSYYFFDFDTYSEKITTPVAGIAIGYNF